MFQFRLADYFVFISTLLVFTAIGAYFGFKALLGSAPKVVPTNKEFLEGHKSHRIIPASLSLCASYVSAVAILGVPVSVYNNGERFKSESVFGVSLFAGVTFLVAIVPFWLSVSFANVVVLPVFYKNKFRTSYDVSVLVAKDRSYLVVCST